MLFRHGVRAPTTVFPADNQVCAFLAQEQREGDFILLLANPEATDDVDEEIKLSRIVPLIALPSSRQILKDLTRMGVTLDVIRDGSGCAAHRKDYRSARRGRAVQPQLSRAPIFHDLKRDSRNARETTAARHGLPNRV
jgi:hypothetical protein